MDDLSEPNSPPQAKKPQLNKRKKLLNKGYTQEVNLRGCSKIISFEYKVSRPIDTYSTLIKGLNGRKVNHAIDPHKDMGMQVEPGATFNLILRAQKCCEQIISG
jgi:hypothetical protein